MAEGATQPDITHGTGGEKSSLVTVNIGGKDFSLAEAEALCRWYASGFFWIVGLSLININMVTIAAADLDFTILDVTGYLGLVAPEAMQVFATVVKDRAWIVGWYVAGLTPIALFGVLGWRARQIERWPYILGMWLYAADSLILLKIDYLAFGSHMLLLLYFALGRSFVLRLQGARQAKAPSPAGSSPSASPGT
jgi:hypothetical protein